MSVYVKSEEHSAINLDPAGPFTELILTQHWKIKGVTKKEK